MTCSTAMPEPSLARRGRHCRASHRRLPVPRSPGCRATRAAAHHSPAPPMRRMSIRRPGLDGLRLRKVLTSRSIACRRIVGQPVQATASTLPHSFAIIARASQRGNLDPRRRTRTCRGTLDARYPGGSEISLRNCANDSPTGQARRHCSMYSRCSIESRDFLRDQQRGSAQCRICQKRDRPRRSIRTVAMPDRSLC